MNQLCIYYYLIISLQIFSDGNNRTATYLIDKYLQSMDPEDNNGTYYFTLPQKFLLSRNVSIINNNIDHIPIENPLLFSPLHKVLQQHITDRRRSKYYAEITSSDCFFDWSDKINNHINYINSITNRPTKGNSKNIHNDAIIAIIQNIDSWGLRFKKNKDYGFNNTILIRDCKKYVKNSDYNQVKLLLLYINITSNKYRFLLLPSKSIKTRRSMSLPNNKTQKRTRSRTRSQTRSRTRSQTRRRSTRKSI